MSRWLYNFSITLIILFCSLIGGIGICIVDNFDLFNIEIVTAELRDFNSSMNVELLQK